MGNDILEQGMLQLIVGILTPWPLSPPRKGILLKIKFSVYLTEALVILCHGFLLLYSHLLYYNNIIDS